MTRTNLFKKLMYRTQRDYAYVKQVQWHMELERLTTLCADTGGESSPFFYRLQVHLDHDPDKAETHPTSV